MIANCAIASVIVPYASEEIHAASVALSARKRVTFDVVVKKQSYKVHVNYCDLYRKAGTNTWEFVASMDDAIPSDTTGDMLVASDVSGILLKAEHTVFELVTRLENPQFPDIQMKELLIN